jgi:hypothetical protein
MVSEWDAFAGNVHLIRTRKPSSPEGNHRRGYQSLFFPSAVEETTRVLCQVAMGCHGAITGCHGLSQAVMGCHRLSWAVMGCRLSQADAWGAELCLPSVCVGSQKLPA